MKLTATIPATLKITEKLHKVYDDATKSFHLKIAISYSPIPIRIQFQQPLARQLLNIAE